MKKFIPLVLFAILVAFLFQGLGRDTKIIPSPLIGKPFPEKIITTLDGAEISLREKLSSTKSSTKLSEKSSAKLSSKFSLVNVWASWCSTCRAEHRFLHEIARHENVRLIGVNYKDTRADARQYLKTLGNPYEFIVFDPDGALGLTLGVYGTPETFLVDGDGIIRAKHIGEMTEAVWDKKLLPLVRRVAAASDS